MSDSFFTNILRQILLDKLRVSKSLRSFTSELADPKSTEFLGSLIQELVLHKFEQRVRSRDDMDELVSFFSGEQKDLHEYSYTKQQ
jgi:hypothetical protein